MRTQKLQAFLGLNAVDYHALPYSGEHEAEHDYSHKMAWLRKGKASLVELAKNLDATPYITTNKSGSIDRGEVSGFLVKDGKTVYIKLSDGMKDILYRTAESTTDYRGGSNNTAPLNGAGWERLTDWVKEQFLLK